MALDTIELVFLALLTLLGLVGAVPHLLHWIKPKPHLQIVKSEISRLPEGNFKYHIHLEIENQTKWWRKNGDASNVVGEYFVIDKNGVQNSAVLNQAISSYLVAGARIVKDIEGYHSFLPDGNPFLLVFRVTCSERQTAKHEITYEAL